jgi:hypothetical protein
MGITFEKIEKELANWINQRELFFVATAPLAGEGLINCSPKGLNTFRILDPVTVAYADLTGSGIETVAHLQENGRITFMFCAFDGPPKIVRLYGSGKFHGLESEGFSRLKDQFGEQIGIRGIIEVSLTRISDSCGYGVPKFEYVGQRDTLTKSSMNKGEQGLADYRKEKNSYSLDGLTGI